MEKDIKLLEQYVGTLRDGRLTDFEAKAVYAKVKHYIAVLKKVGELKAGLKK